MTCDSFHNATTGETIEIYQEGVRIYDSEGNLVYDSFYVEDLIKKGDLVGAAECILNYLGYEIKEKQIVYSPDGTQIIGLLTIEIDGWETNILIYIPESSKDHKKDMGLSIFVNGAMKIQKKN